MNVPYSAIDRFEQGFHEEWMKRVDEASRGTQFIGGSWVKRLEGRLATEAGVAEARVCANGTDALQIGLRALGVSPGDRVLVPELTFWATFEAVCMVGAKPVTVDVDAEDLHWTAALVERAIREFKPQAAILVHLYGWAARETQAIRALCAREGVKLLEDSAQAWGVRLGGEPLFKGALLSTISFYPGKVLGAAGDGGALLTQDSELAQDCWRLANHGRLSKYEHGTVGWNSRMDNLQAAYVDLSLDHIAGRISSRREAAAWYRENVKLPGLRFLAPGSGVEENGYISVALVEPINREGLLAKLQEQGIGYAVVYPMPTSRQPGAKDWVAGKLDLGNAQRVCQGVVNLPCFAGIRRNEQERVAEVLRGALA